MEESVMQSWELAFQQLRCWHPSNSPNAASEGSGQVNHTQTCRQFLTPGEPEYLSHVLSQTQKPYFVFDVYYKNNRFKIMLFKIFKESAAYAENTSVCCTW